MCRVVVRFSRKLRYDIKYGIYSWRMILDELKFPAGELALSQRGVFSQLFNQVNAQLYRYLYSLTGGPAEDVDDLVAETFARAWSARESFQGDFNAALHWLLVIAKNQVIDVYRRRKTSGSSEALDEVGELPAPDADPETQALDGEQRRTLWRLLQSLPEEAREILVLRYMLDRPVGDIAAYLGKKETAVSMVIHRALKRLQQSWPLADLLFRATSKSNV